MGALARSGDVRGVIDLFAAMQRQLAGPRPADLVQRQLPSPPQPLSVAAGGRTSTGGGGAGGAGGARFHKKRSFKLMLSAAGVAARDAAAAAAAAAAAPGTSPGAAAAAEAAEAQAALLAEITGLMADAGVRPAVDVTARAHTRVTTSAHTRVTTSAHAHVTASAHAHVDGGGAGCGGPSLLPLLSLDRGLPRPPTAVVSLDPRDTQLRRFLRKKAGQMAARWPTPPPQTPPGPSSPPGALGPGDGIGNGVRAGAGSPPATPASSARVLPPPRGERPMPARSEMRRAADRTRNFQLPRA
jgi:hypothetical protein